MAVEFRRLNEFVQAPELDGGWFEARPSSCADCGGQLLADGGDHRLRARVDLRVGERVRVLGIASGLGIAEGEVEGEALVRVRQARAAVQIEQLGRLAQLACGRAN